MCSLRRYIVILMNQRAVGHGETLLKFSTFRSIAFRVALSCHWSNCLIILSYCMALRLLSISGIYLFLLACTIYELLLLFFNLLRFKPFLWHFSIWHRKDEQLYFRRKVFIWVWRCSPSYCCGMGRYLGEHDAFCYAFNIIIHNMYVESESMILSIHTVVERSIRLNNFAEKMSCKLHFQCAVKNP